MYAAAAELSGNISALQAPLAAVTAESAGAPVATARPARCCSRRYGLAARQAEGLPPAGRLCLASFPLPGCCMLATRPEPALCPGSRRAQQQEGGQPHASPPACTPHTHTLTSPPLSPPRLRPAAALRPLLQAVGLQPVQVNAVLLSLTTYDFSQLTAASAAINNSVLPAINNSIKPVGGGCGVGSGASVRTGLLTVWVRGRGRSLERGEYMRGVCMCVCVCFHLHAFRPLHALQLPAARRRRLWRASTTGSLPP